MPNYGWVEGEAEFNPGTIGQIAISNGVVTMDVSATNAGDGGTDAQFATFLGDFKDALETAGFTLGIIRSPGGISKTLEEI